MKRDAAWLETRAVQVALATSARFSVIITDDEGLIQFFNAGAERMLGYASAEVVNKIHLVDLYDPQDVMARIRALSLELSTAIASGFHSLTFKASRGIQDGYDLAYLCKDGSRLPASVSITAVRDEHGINTGYLWIGADDSDRKQLELKLHKALSDAENAELAKANHLSNMSHELRTPLNAILGFAQLMSSGLPSPTVSQKRKIELILEAGWHQLQLINEVRDLALIDSGRLPLSLEPISLAEIMRECQDMTELLAQSRGVHLICPTIEASHCVRADRARVQQVLVSLLSHAINHSKAGGTVVIDYDIRNPECIRFRIQPGGGRSADPGIGMVLTKRLIELMGGTMNVGSNVGTDHVLWFELKRFVHPPNEGSALTYSSFEQAAKPGVIRDFINEQVT